MSVTALDTNARVQEELRSWAESSPAGAATAVTTWADLLRDEGFHFEGRAYPVGLLPLVLSTGDVAQFVDMSRRIISLLERSLRLFAGEPRLQAMFPEYDGMFSGWEQPAYRPLVRMARFDCAWTGPGEVKVLETNTSSPGGSIQNPLVYELWRSLPLADRLLAELSPVSRSADRSCSSRAMTTACGRRREWRR